MSGRKNAHKNIQHEQCLPKKNAFRRNIAQKARRSNRVNYRVEGIHMITEIAILDVRHGQQGEFEKAFKEAQKIISSMDGYISHSLQKCIENPGRYLLKVKWRTLEDHTIGFRESKEYLSWKELLHHFYEPFPVVEHYLEDISH